MSGPVDPLLLAASRSVVWHSIEIVVTMTRRAWDSSTAAALVDRGRRRWGTMNLATRIRHGALTLASAGLFYFTLLPVIPRYVAPGLPRVGVAGFAVGAALVARFANEFARAWPESGTRKYLDSVRDS